MLLVVASVVGWLLFMGCSSLFSGLAVAALRHALAQAHACEG